MQMLNAVTDRTSSLGLIIIAQFTRTCINAFPLNAGFSVNQECFVEMK